MIYLVITIDVEPDSSSTWHYADPLTFEGVSIGIRERLQPLFISYGVSPTYLVNNVVLEDENSVQALLMLEGKYELGTHLHPEFIEPQKLYYRYAGKKAESNQCTLDSDIEFLKLKNITDLFVKKIGYQPHSFRAGRFSAGANTISSLERLSYKVDTSVTPHLNWNDETREVAIDFTKAYEQPYFIKSNSLLEKDSRGAILEVPISVTTRTPFLGKKQPIWLRPSCSNYRELVKVTKRYVNTYRNSNIVALNMMFHNVEVIPDKSPYARSEKSCKKILENLKRYLDFSRSSNIKVVTLSELYEVYRRKK